LNSRFGFHFILIIIFIELKVKNSHQQPTVCSRQGHILKFNTSFIMSRRTSVILAVAAFLVGLFTGGWSVATYYGRYTDRLTINMLDANATVTVAILNRLRAGYTTNAVEILETGLDGDLICLGGFLVHPGELKRDPLTMEAIQMVRDYRLRFPHKSGSPTVDVAASKVFVVTDGTNGNH
jgi:hypothetical protein